MASAATPATPASAAADDDDGKQFSHTESY
jgi:hypothetical protein